MYGLDHTSEQTWPIRNGSQRFQDSDERRDWQLLLQVIYFVNKCEAMFSTERTSSALESCSYLKLTSLLESSQQLCNAKWRGNENGKKTNKQTTKQ